MKNRFYPVVAFCFLLFFSTVAFGVEGIRIPPEDRVPGELIIGFKPEVSIIKVHQVISSINGKILKHFNAPRGRIVRVNLPSTAPSTLDDAIRTLQSDPAFSDLIRYVEPNVIQYAQQVRPTQGDAGILSQTGDPLLGGQWGYYNISAQWPNTTASGSGVTVAVIDTGVDYNHPDLLKKVTKGSDWVNGEKDPMDDHGHGTHVSGIIAAIANNNYGIAGVAWNAKIYAVKVLSTQGWGMTFDIALGIYEAANNNSVKVINMSLGGYTPTTTQQDAVEYAVVTKGKLLVAAAGNDNTNQKLYPAGYSTTYPGRVLAVAAHGADNCRASFSNYGTWISITAPGVGILSTIPNSLGTQGFASWNGTSMATPFVAGAAALAWEKNPSFTNTEIANLITTMTNLPYTPLNRNGTCWPNDGSGFQRLDVLHILEQQFYEACNNHGAISGYSFDAETGLPLAGGLITATQGSTVTGTDYVPFYGELMRFGDDSLAGEGYGLFNVLTDIGSNNLTITKKNYMSFTPKDQSGNILTLPVYACSWTYGGNIPVPPKKREYWLAISWNYGYTGALYDLYLQYYDGSYYYYYYNNPGSILAYPYVKYLWDSDFGDTGAGTMRNYAETIRIAKLTRGAEYLFFVYDWKNGTGSTNWSASGIKAYLYKGSTLIKTYTPPSGSGGLWVIGEIIGGTIYDLNYLTD